MPKNLSKTHELKTHPMYFNYVKRGLKPFEIRKNDRDYTVGDILHLLEWNPVTEQYTGRELKRRVMYIFKGGSLGVQKGYVVMGLTYVK